MTSYKWLFITSKDIVPSPSYRQFKLVSIILSRDENDGHLPGPYQI